VARCVVGLGDLASDLLDLGLVAKNPVVAVFNTNDDIVEMLRIVLEHAGFIVVSAHVDAMRRGEQSLANFVEEHDPELILYDLVPPYDRSWRFLEHLRQTPHLAGRKFIITSTNAARATEIIGNAAHVYEIIGKPYDIDEIVRAAQRATGRDSELPPGAKRA
jgi:CheY-like chemotaxis protein